MRFGERAGLQSKGAGWVGLQSRFTFNSREGWKDEILVRLIQLCGSLAGLSVLAFQFDIEKDIYEKESFWRKLNSIKSRKSFSLMFASLRSLL